MSHFLNHRPDQVGIWFDYDGNRYKDYYDLRLKTGEVVLECYPNASGWYPNKGRDCVHDCEIDQVRLKPDVELHEFAHVDEERLERNLHMFAGAIPEFPRCFPLRGNEALKDRLNDLGYQECNCCKIFGQHLCPDMPDRKWDAVYVMGLFNAVDAIVNPKIQVAA